jgi:hypothetical protein
MKSFTFILGVALLGCAYINASELASGKEDCGGCKKRKHNYESSSSYLSDKDSSCGEFDACSGGRHRGHRRHR